MKMKTHLWGTYGTWVLFTEAVGGLAGWLTRDGTQLYSQVITKPPLSPPSIVFPIVWVILFALMGIGAARVYLAPPSGLRSRSLLLFLVQLAFNFFWSIIFFQFQNFGFALVWLAVLWAHAAVLPAGGLHRRVAASPISPLGDLCGLSQLGCLAAQSTLKKAPGS